MAYEKGTATNAADFNSKLAGFMSKAGWEVQTTNGTDILTKDGIVFIPKTISYSGTTMNGMSFGKGAVNLDAQYPWETIENFMLPPTTGGYPPVCITPYEGSYHFFSYENPHEIYAVLIPGGGIRNQFVALGFSDMPKLPGTTFWATASETLYGYSSNFFLQPGSAGEFWTNTNTYEGVLFSNASLGLTTSAENVHSPWLQNADCIIYDSSLATVNLQTKDDPFIFASQAVIKVGFPSSGFTVYACPRWFKFCHVNIPDEEIITFNKNTRERYIIFSISNNYKIGFRV